MGGMNSSRWRGYNRRTTVEECKVISAPSLHDLDLPLTYDFLGDNDFQGSITETVTVGGKSEWTTFTFTITPQRLAGC